MRKWVTHNSCLAIITIGLLALLYVQLNTTNRDLSAPSPTVNVGADHDAFTQGTAPVRSLPNDSAIYTYSRPKESPKDFQHMDGDFERTETTPEYLQGVSISLFAVQDKKERQKQLRNVARELGLNHDFEGASEILEIVTDSEEQHYFARVFTQLLVRTDDHQGAAQWALQIANNEIRESIVGLIAESWAFIAPEAAARWADSLPQKTLSFTAHEGIVKSITKQNLQDGYDWAIEIKDLELRDTLLKQVGLVFARKFPAAAMNWAMDFDHSETGPEILNYALLQWTQKDLDSAAGWVEHLPEKYITRQVINTIASTMAKTEPVGAAHWARQFDTIPEMNAVLLNIATVWAQKDPEAATRWAQQFSDPRTKSDVTAQTAYHWALRNPRAAAQWLSRQPTDE